MVRQAHLKSIALFGGSFDPPHWAHRQVLEYLCGLPQFHEVWMVISFDHPFEKNLLPFDKRKEMCELTIAGLGEKVKISGIEGELSQSPSYMIDTVLELKKRNPDCRFVIVLGSDCKKELVQWRDIEKLKKEAEFFYIPRPGFNPSPFMNISSTQIRQWVRENKPYTKYLVPEVYEYIHMNRLYVQTRQ